MWQVGMGTGFLLDSIDAARRMKINRPTAKGDLIIKNPPGANILLGEHMIAKETARLALARE